MFIYFKFPYIGVSSRSKAGLAFSMSELTHEELLKIDRCKLPDWFVMVCMSEYQRRRKHYRIKHEKGYHEHIKENNKKQWRRIKEHRELALGLTGPAEIDLDTLATTAVNFKRQ